MLSDRDALLAAIRANPEEDTPRLMFADWLDEQGDDASLARAEFIRLQCEIARLDADGSDSQPVYEFLRDRDYVTRPTADWTKIDDGIHRRIALAIRARDLLARHAPEWVPNLPKKHKVEWLTVPFSDKQPLGFHRGFPHRVVLSDVPKLGAIAEQLRRAAPAVTLVASDLSSEFVERLADAGLLGWITGLQLRGDVAGGLRAFGHRPEAAGVRSIAVEDGTPFALTAALADPPHWTGLRSLDLSRTTVDALGAEELFRAPHLRTLKRLAVSGRFWTAEAIRALTENGFTELTTLRLTGCGLTDDAAEALAACPALARLRELDLGSNAITGRGVTALLCSPQLANVSYLGLEQNLCNGPHGGGLDGKQLAACEPGGLRMLHCHGCRFVTADVRKLARCPRLRTLWYLDLDQTGIGTPAVRELIRGFGKWCPPIIWLTYNGIDDLGAELLARWKAARALRVLHLRYNAPMTDAAARALLDSPHLTNLDGLGVSGASPDTTDRLRARFKHFDINY
jgi:uncharacterized protein (TIGR02996 family)